MDIYKIDKLIEKEQTRKLKYEKQKFDKTKYYEDKICKFKETIQKEKEEKLKGIIDNIKLSDKKLAELNRLHDVLVKANDDLNNINKL